MRRKDRERPRSEAYEIIDQARYGVLAFSGEAYAVPMSFVRKGDQIYMHGAKQGSKMTRILENPHVAMVFVEEPHVPDLYTNEELSRAIENKEMRVFSRVFTTDFRSAIAKGTIEVIEDEIECADALFALSERYLPKFSNFARAAYESSKMRTAVLKLTIHELTAKEKTTEKIPLSIPE